MGRYFFFEAGQERGLNGIWAHGDWLTNIALAADDARIVTLGRDGQMQLWSDPIGISHGLHYGFTDWVDYADISPDNRLVAGGGFAGELIVWEVATGAMLWSHPMSSGIKAIVFDPIVPWVWVGNTFGTVVAYDLETFTEVQGSRFAVSGNLRHMEISPNGEIFAFVTTDYVLHVRSRTDLATDIGTYALSDDVASLIFSPDNRWLGLSLVDDEVLVWNIRDRVLVRSEIMRDVASIHFADDSSFMAMSDFDGNIRTIDISNAASTVEPWLFTLPRAYDVGLYHAEATVPIRALANHRWRITYTAISDDGSLIISSGLDGTIRLWGIAAE